MARTRQTSIAFPCTWGGKRKHAGRKRQGPRKRVSHTTRPALASRFPVHVTVRLAPGMPRLRGRKAAKALRHAFVHGCDRGRFRICQFSVQGNHVHLVCEAADAIALARGIQGWKIRVTRRLNRLWHRCGTVWDDRYHSQIIKSLRQVRNTLCYVLHNARRHGETLPKWAHGIDPYSSAYYFDGWKDDLFREGLSPPQDDEPPPVAEAHTWILTKGWQRYGLIGIHEVPTPDPSQPRLS